MLKRGIEVLVGAALVVAMLAVLPVVAEAPQGMTATQDARGANRGADAASASLVVVRPGDSLWSIGEERLGPDATLQQIASGVEWIYALNRNQIGADPDLILPGQSLLLPLVSGATPARDATEPTQTDPMRRATGSGPDQAPSPTAGQADLKAGEAPDAVGKRANLPDMARPALLPAARSLAQDDSPRSPAESFARKARSAASAAASAVAREPSRDGYTERRLLGAALLAMSSALALVLAQLVARELGSQARGERRARERWAREVRKNYAAFEPLLEGEKNGRIGDGIPTADAGNGTYPPGLLASAHRRWRACRLGLPRGPARRVRKGLATGAHSPDVRHLLRSASGNGGPKATGRVRPLGDRASHSAAPKRGIGR